MTYTRIFVVVVIVVGSVGCRMKFKFLGVISQVFGEN